MNWIILLLVTSTLVHFGVAQRGYNYDKPSKPFSTNYDVPQENYSNQQNFVTSEPQSNNGRQPENRFSPKANNDIEQQNYPNRQNTAGPQPFNQNNFPGSGQNGQKPERLSSNQNGIKQQNYPNRQNTAGPQPFNQNNFPASGQNGQTPERLSSTQNGLKQQSYPNRQNTGTPQSFVQSNLPSLEQNEPTSERFSSKQNSPNRFQNSAPTRASDVPNFKPNQQYQNPDLNNFQTAPQQPRYQNENNGKSGPKISTPQNGDNFNSQNQITSGYRTPSRTDGNSQTTANRPQSNSNLKPQQRFPGNEYSGKDIQNQFPTTQSTQNQDGSSRQGNRGDDSVNQETDVPLDSRNSNAPGKSNRVPFSNTESNEVEYESSYAAIPGEPEVDYPIYSEVPDTSFKCSDQPYPGYYADVEARCQVFHICTLNQMYDFLCPNGTIFHQEYLVCVWWNQFNCSSAPGLYEINAYIYGSNETQSRYTSDNNVNNLEDQRGSSDLHEKDNIENGDRRPPSGAQSFDDVTPTDSNGYTKSRGGQIQETEQNSRDALTRFQNNGYPSTSKNTDELQTTGQFSNKGQTSNAGYGTTTGGDRDTNESSGDTSTRSKASNGVQNTRQFSNKVKESNAPGSNAGYGTTPNFRNTYQTAQPQTPSFGLTNNVQDSNSNFRSPTNGVETTKSQTSTSTPQLQFTSITPANPTYPSQSTQNFRQPSQGSTSEYSRPRPESGFSEPGNIDNSRLPFREEESTRPNYQSNFGTQQKSNEANDNREGYRYNRPGFDLSTNNVEQPGREYLPPYTG